MQKCVKSLTLEVTPGFEPGNQGFADPCLTTWLCHHLRHLYYMQTFRKSPHLFFELQCPHSRVGIASGAGNEARTRYLHLGKVALYQMSYARRTQIILTGIFPFVNPSAKFSTHLP